MLPTPPVATLKTTPEPIWSIWTLPPLTLRVNVPPPPGATYSASANVPPEMLILSTLVIDRASTLSPSIVTVVPSDEYVGFITAVRSTLIVSVPASPSTLMGESSSGEMLKVS